jgi:UDP-N-acetylmuramoylalanine--D-glutamate ligase
VRLADLRGRDVVVWGTGREGRAALAAIRRVGPGDLSVVADGAEATEFEGAPLFGGAGARDRLLGADVVVRSPGVPQTHPWVGELRARGVPVTGGTALWMADHAARTVAVTGSKGKSTTSSLISHLLTAVGRPNVFGGNIGVPLLELPEADRYVVELSSYQCSDLTDSPRVAVVTALFPEHLDAHGGEREYYRDKLNLLAHGPELIVVNGADPRLAAELTGVRDASGRAPVDATAAFGVDDQGYVVHRSRRLFPRSAFRLVGRHNERNLAVALAVLDALGVDVDAAAEPLAAGVASYAALPHRLTEIESAGLTFVDDTLATSPYATMHAVDAYPGRPLTLIVGGADRGVDYVPLREHLRGRELTVLGIPDSGPRILAVLDGLPGIRTELADDLVEAVHRARTVTPPGGVVLLSPGAPSYGRFRNFEHRSEVFAQAVRDSA